MARITWQNVYGGKGSSEASQILGTAQRTFDGVLDRADKLLQNNQQRQTDENTRAFMDFVGQFRTPDELQAAMQSGVIDQHRQGYGTMIDDALARTAAQNQLDSLRAGAVASEQFNHRGTLGQIMLTAAGGDLDTAFDTARSVPSSVLTPDFIKSLHDYDKSHSREARDQGRHDSDMLTSKQNREQGAYDFNRRKEMDSLADTENEWSNHLGDFAIQAGRAVHAGEITSEEASALFRDQVARIAQDIGAGRALALAERENPAFELAKTSFGPERMEQVRKEQQAAAEEADWRANSPAAVGSREARLNQDDLVKWITEEANVNYSEDQLQKSLRTLARIYDEIHITTPDGVRIGPTQEIIKSAFLAAHDGWTVGKGTKATNFYREVKKTMDNAYVIKQLYERHARDRAQVTGDTETLTKTLNKLREQNEH